MKNIEKRTFYLETLGCPRNEADSEALIRVLESSGFKFSESPVKADIIIVNGCAFIEESVSESINTILSLSEKNQTALLIAVGCLAQRYGKDLLNSMDELDLLIGTGSLERISEVINTGKSDINSNFGFLGKNLYKSARVTPSHYRYIKIQEGCDFKCSFCVIPQLKGASHSKEFKIIKEEVLNLPSEVKEIIIIGQNTTSWGKDLGQSYKLSDVVREIASIFPGWVRLLYFHPLFVSEKLLKTMKDLPNVVNYLDIPLQHIADSVLSDMERGYGRKKIEELLAMIHEIGNFTLRSTFIVGFPTESRENFEELSSFLEGSDIDYIGIFGYSHEEGSSSFSMKCLPKKEIMERIELISPIIEEKMKNKNEQLIGEKMGVLIDGLEEGQYYGRTRASAPDIDPLVWISPREQNLSIGGVYRCSITDVLGCDLAGEIV